MSQAKLLPSLSSQINLSAFQLDLAHCAALLDTTLFLTPFHCTLSNRIILDINPPKLHMHLKENSKIRYSDIIFLILILLSIYS